MGIVRVHLCMCTWCVREYKCVCLHMSVHVAVNTCVKAYLCVCFASPSPQLRSSDKNTADLTTLVDKLRQLVDEKDARLDEITASLLSLKEDMVAGVQEKQKRVAERERAVQALEHEMVCVCVNMRVFV